MTVRELIHELLDCAMDEEVMIEASGFKNDHPIVIVEGSSRGQTDIQIDFESADLELDELELVEK